MTTMRVVGECFFWYRLTRVFPDKFHRAVKRLCVFHWVITHDGGSQCVGGMISGICDFACLSEYPYSKRKMAGAISSKAGRHTVHSSHPACIDSQVKRSEVKVTQIQLSDVQDCLDFLVL